MLVSKYDSLEPKCSLNFHVEDSTGYRNNGTMFRYGQPRRELQYCAYPGTLPKDVNSVRKAETRLFNFPDIAVFFCPQPEEFWHNYMHASGLRDLGIPTLSIVDTDLRQDWPTVEEFRTPLGVVVGLAAFLQTDSAALHGHLACLIAPAAKMAADAEYVNRNQQKTYANSWWEESNSGQRVKIDPAPEMSTSTGDVFDGFDFESFLKDDSLELHFDPEAKGFPDLKPEESLPPSSPLDFEGITNIDIQPVFERIDFDSFLYDTSELPPLPQLLSLSDSVHGIQPYCEKQESLSEGQQTLTSTESDITHKGISQDTTTEHDHNCKFHDDAPPSIVHTECSKYDHYSSDLEKGFFLLRPDHTPPSTAPQVNLERAWLLARCTLSSVVLWILLWFLLLFGRSS